MNSDTLLTHIRLEQRCLIDIDKKLHELECLLSCSDPIRFFEVAKNMALLSERSTAQLRNFLFTVCGGMPPDYYLQAAEMQGICVDVTDSILSVRLPALLPKKTRTEGFKFLQPALHAALKQYAEQQNLPTSANVPSASNMSMTAACPSKPYAIMTILKRKKFSTLSRYTA